MNYECLNYKRSAHNLCHDDMLSCSVFFFVFHCVVVHVFVPSPVRPNRTEPNRIEPNQMMKQKTEERKKPNEILFRFEKCELKQRHPTVNVLVNQCDLWWCCACKLVRFECACGSIVEGGNSPEEKEKRPNRQLDDDENQDNDEVQKWIPLQKEGTSTIVR